MKVKVLAVLMVVALVLAGCCANPGVFGQLKQSEQAIQGAYYTASGAMKNDVAMPDKYVALGGMSADLLLGLGGAMQTQYCPSQKAADDLAKQVNTLPLVKEAVPSLP